MSEQVPPHSHGREKMQAAGSRQCSGAWAWVGAPGQLEQATDQPWLRLCGQEWRGYPPSFWTPGAGAVTEWAPLAPLPFPAPLPSPGGRKARLSAAPQPSSPAWPCLLAAPFVGTRTCRNKWAPFPTFLGSGVSPVTYESSLLLCTASSQGQLHGKMMPKIWFQVCCSVNLGELLNPSLSGRLAQEVE